MSNILIRHIPSRAHCRIRAMANAQNLSMNQFIFHLLITTVREQVMKRGGERHDKEIFRRIREIREENFRQYGFSDDSTKIIREFRDRRNQ